MDFSEKVPWKATGYEKDHRAGASYGIGKSGMGYDRIQGALKNLGHKVATTTIANILKRHGIEPASERSKKTTWKTFLKAHWETFTAADFFTVEVWTIGGLVTFYILFVIDFQLGKSISQVSPTLQTNPS